MQVESMNHMSAIQRFVKYKLVHLLGHGVIRSGHWLCS